MKKRFITLFLFLVLLAPRVEAQDHALADLVKAITVSINQRMNHHDHKMAPGAVSPILLDSQVVTTFDSLYRYDLDDVQEVRVDLSNSPKLAALFGSRARYGVIFITRKKPRKSVR